MLSSAGCTFDSLQSPKLVYQEQTLVIPHHADIPTSPAIINALAVAHLIKTRRVTLEDARLHSAFACRRLIAVLQQTLKAHQPSTMKIFMAWTISISTRRERLLSICICRRARRSQSCTYNIAKEQTWGTYLSETCAVDVQTI